MMTGKIQCPTCQEILGIIEKESISQQDIDSYAHPMKELPGYSGPDRYKAVCSLGHPALLVLDN